MTYKIETFDIACWRFSKLPITKIPLSKINTYDNKINFLESILLDKKISKELATLYGKNGESLVKSILSLIHGNVSTSKTAKKKIDYLVQLLISLSYRNDTGKKGSVNIFFFDSFNNNINKDMENNKNVDLMYPEGNNESILEISRLHNNETDLSKRLKLKYFLMKEPINYYRFTLDFTKRLELSDTTIKKIFENQQKIGKLLCDHIENKLSKFIIPFCVDYFLQKNNEPVVIEIHCPPRTIEVMFSGFRPFFPKIKFPTDILIEKIIEFYKNIKKTDPTNAIFYCSVPNLAFFRIEAENILSNFKKLGVQEIQLKEKIDQCYPVTNSFVIEGRYKKFDIVYFLDIIDGSLISRVEGPVIIPPCEIFELIQDRKILNEKFKDYNIPTPENLFLQKKSNIDFPYIEKKFGNWIVVKSRQNLPWWSDTKKRVEFLSLTDDLHREKLVKLVSMEDIIIEKCIQDSIDKKNNFGEFRVYGIAKSI